MRLPRGVRVLGAGLLLGVPACLGVGATSNTAPLVGPHLVLFVGNSLTYTNDLPRTLADLAASGGDTLTTGAVALPNFALIDHALGGSNALDVIRRSHWEYVVLQQGPTWPGLCLDTLVLATRLLDEHIRAAGARTAVMMTWPSLADSAGFNSVLYSYRTAADTVGALFLPAGEAWRTAWRADAGLTLYGPDLYHPSPLGTLLAALVIYERLTGHDARALPAVAVVAGQRLDVSEATVRLLQSAAHESNLQFQDASQALAPPARQPWPAGSSGAGRAAITC